MKTISRGFFALIFVVLESALVTIALQVGGSSIGAVPLLLYASIAGALTMLVVAYLQDKGKEFISILRDRKTLLILALTGIFTFAIGTLTLTWGTLGTTPSISAIVYRTYPLIIAILTPMTLRQKVNTRQLLGLALGFISVGIVLSNGSLTSINFSELPYIALVLFSALTVVVSTLIIKAYNTSTTAFILIGNIASLIFVLPIILIFLVQERRLLRFQLQQSNKDVLVFQAELWRELQLRME